jgi:uncharacterized membrane protein YgdD (TMEM256/DUF423 family)
MSRRWVVAGALLAFVAVLAGAFGAHALRDRLDPSQQEAFETAVRYQMYHALALLILGAGWGATRRRAFGFVAVGFVVGVVLFSGSIYGLTLLGWRWLGPVTPVGGAVLLVCWAVLAVAAWRGAHDARVAM